MTRPEAAASLPANQSALREATLPSINWRQRNGKPEPKWRPAWRRVADWLFGALARRHGHGDAA